MIKDKLDFIIIKNCSSNDAARKMKRQATEWKKTVGMCLSDKGAASRIHKEHL